MNGKCFEKSLTGSDNGLTLLKYGLLIRKKEQHRAESKKKDEKISELQGTIFKLQDVANKYKNQLKDMKESQMNTETTRVQDLITENKKIHEHTRLMITKMEELANECQENTIKLPEQSRLLELKEERIKELEYENHEILESKKYFEELSENMKQVLDENEKEKEEMKNDLNDLKELAIELQNLLEGEEKPDDQSYDDGLKVGPKEFQVVDERDILLKENEELRQRLTFDEKMNKESTEMLEEETLVFEKKIIDLEKNIEMLKNGIDEREEERNAMQKNFDKVEIVVEEEKKLRVMLEEKLEEITTEKDDIGRQFEDLMQKCDGLNTKLDEEFTLRGKATEKLEEITAEKEDMEKQLEDLMQTCDGLNAKLDEEINLRGEIEEKLEKITAERDEVNTNLAKETKIREQVEKSLDEITTEKNELVVEKIELYKNYINEKNKRFEIEDELAKSEDLIEELRVRKLNCFQVLIPCCFRRRR